MRIKQKVLLSPPSVYPRPYLPSHPLQLFSLTLHQTHGLLDLLREHFRHKETPDSGTLDLRLPHHPPYSTPLGGHKAPNWSPRSPTSWWKKISKDFWPFLICHNYHVYFLAFYNVSECKSGILINTKILLKVFMRCRNTFCYVKISSLNDSKTLLHHSCSFSLCIVKTLSLPLNKNENKQTMRK